MKRWSFVIASALVVHLTTAGGAGAQAMKTPGQSSSQSNVVKPAPLDFSPELLQSLRLPAGFKIEKFAEGLKAPRVIVVGPNGGLYVSSRDEGTITFLSDRGGTADGGRIVLQKPNVHGIAVREERAFLHHNP
jgi:glucose/arabinose dehydrogenase